MKKNYLFLFAFLISMMSYAQESGVIKYSTTHALGTEISFFPTTLKSGEKIKVDWGDGEIKEYELSMWNKRVSGDKAGDTIKIHTQLLSFDCSDGEVTSLAIIDQPGLKTLQCYNNKITRDSLDVSGALNLTSLDCHNNKLLFLNLLKHTQLVNLDCFNYEKGTITTILLPQSGSALESISAYGNDISALDISGCPGLTSINMEDNALMVLDVSGLSNLRYLNVEGNYISDLSLSKNTKLEKIFCGKNQLKKLDLFANKELIEISCSENQLSELDLSGNVKLTKLYCSKNVLKSLDLTNIPKLTQLQCGFNQLENLNLSGNFYLQKIWCQSNKLTSLDFYYNSNINYIDCQNNSEMTPCALNYMYRTLSGMISQNPNDNLLVKGCNAETSDTNIALETRWQTDIKGDGTATCDDVEATIISPVNGTFTLSQPILTNHDSIIISDNKIKAGVPVYIKATPAENYKVKSVLINNKLINEYAFTTSEAVSVAVNFVPVTSSNYMTMGVAEGAVLSLGISGTEPETEVEVDWGNGKIETLIVYNTKTSRIEGTAKGTTIRINGLLNYLDCSENDLTSLDVSHNNVLKTLDCYWTYITTLDLSKNTELGKLNCSYNSLSTLDLSANTKLFSLTCYNCELKALDLSHNTLLEELTAKNNELTTIDLTTNKQLMALDIQNNKLESMNFAELTNLESLLCSGNGMTQLNLAQNTKLTNLVCSNNKLTDIDLSRNTSLERLFCHDNQLTALNLSNNESVNYIECSGNGLSACALNDFYYNLPLCPVEPEKNNIYNAGVTNTNDAERSETTIATKKGWKVSAEGDGTGCNEAYISFTQPENGTIELFNSDSQEIKSGTKVTKNLVIEVKSTPANGYELEYVKANSVTVVDNTFTVTRATEVVAKFKLYNSIDQTGSEISIWTGKNTVNISAENAIAKIYTLIGVLVYEGIIQGENPINLSSGTYILKLATGEKQISQVLSVY